MKQYNNQYHELATHSMDSMVEFFILLMSQILNSLACGMFPHVFQRGAGDICPVELKASPYMCIFIPLVQHSYMTEEHIVLANFARLNLAP